MQPIPSKRRSHSSLAVRAGLLLIAAGACGACDRHSAEEVPESYGHGSSHERVSPDHQVDSSNHTQSFSDTVGTKDEKAEDSRAASSASPTPTPANHFY